MSIVVLISGTGTNLQAIIDSGLEVSHVISNISEAPGLLRAEKARIPWSVYPRLQDLEKYTTEICKQEDPNYIILAGFMRILNPNFIHEWNRKIINIHPSLLPAFKGNSAIKDAWEYGVKVTGVTVHYVDEGMDTGQIIAQKAIRITGNDTLKSLEKKIHKVEHKMYPQVIGQMLTGFWPNGIY